MQWWDTLAHAIKLKYLRPNIRWKRIYKNEKRREDRSHWHFDPKLTITFYSIVFAFPSGHNFSARSRRSKSFRFSGSRCGELHSVDKLFHAQNFAVQTFFFQFYLHTISDWIFSIFNCTSSHAPHVLNRSYNFTIFPTSLCSRSVIIIFLLCVSHFISAALPEVILRNCRNCSPQQAANAQKLTNFLQTRYPDVWAMLIRKYRGV